MTVWIAFGVTWALLGFVTAWTCDVLDDLKRRLGEDARDRKDMAESARQLWVEHRELAARLRAAELRPDAAWPARRERYAPALRPEEQD